MNALKDTRDREGEDAFNYALEEMSELIKAICKYREGIETTKEIAEKVADVIIIVGVLKYVVPEITKEKLWFLYTKLGESGKKL